jgi:predicted nucleic acid-binding protein
VTTYVDTSALVKRYIRERGSDRVRELLGREPFVASSAIICAEMPAAFARAKRERNITVQGERLANDGFDATWSDLLLVPVTAELARAAGVRATNHGLRGYDAVHLASALFVSFAIGSPVTLATFDGALWEAAKAEGLQTWPASLPT